MGAAAGLLLVHVPLAAALSSVAEFPWQTDEGPVIGVTIFTTTGNVATQPAGVVYVIVTAPGSAPKRSPEGPIVAIDVAELVHVPETVGLLRVVVLPSHTLALPPIGKLGLIVMTVVAKQPPTVE